MNNSLIGQQFANYRIEYLLGRGGMAEVYYAHDTQLQRPAAIKLIDARYRDNPDYARRFLQEARTIATWRHENIVQVYYADEQDGVYFFAMEYIDGLDVADILKKYGKDGELMPHTDVIHIGTVTANALDYAHSKGVIHRDIKPSNIMIGRDNRVVLMDFGLALDVQEGTLGETFGSAHYIAPEQAMKSSNAVPVSDLYALGVIMYEMLTGVVPFDDESYTSVVMQHLTEPPPSPRQYNPELSEAVENVLLKALHKEPDHRYATCTEFMAELSNALTQNPNLADTDKYKLPPLPANMAQPNMPTMSTVTVADRIAFEQSLRATSIPIPDPYQMATDAPIPTAQTTQSSRKLPILPIIGGVVLLAILIVGFLVLSGGGDDTKNDNAVAQNTTTEIAPPTDVPTLESTQAETSPSEATTSIPSAPVATTPAPIESTITPTISEPTQIIPTSTVPTIPVFTKIPLTPTTAPILPSATLAPTLTPIPQEPTIAYPNGHPFTLHYDGVSFYALNTGGRSFNIRGLSFEALDATGNPTGKSFSSQRWIAIGGYASIDNNRCDEIEMGGEVHLNPSVCGGFNANLNPLDNELFWQSSDTAVEFRILWNNEEVGRCPVFTDTAQVCDIKLPQ